MQNPVKKDKGNIYPEFKDEDDILDHFDRVDKWKKDNPRAAEKLKEQQKRNAEKLKEQQKKPYKEEFGPGKWYPDPAGIKVAKGGNIKKLQMVHGGAYKGKKHSYAAGGVVKNMKIMRSK